MRLEGKQDRAGAIEAWERLLSAHPGYPEGREGQSIHREGARSDSGGRLARSVDHMITLICVDQAPFGRSRAGPDRFLSQPAPRLPRHDRIATQTVVGCASIVFHIVAVTVLLVLVSLPSAPVPSTSFRQTAPDPAPLRFVFLPKSESLLVAEAVAAATGRAGPFRAPGEEPRCLHAAGREADPSAPRPVDAPPQAQAVAIDAVPLASGPTVQVGLPDGLLTAGSSEGRDPEAASGPALERASAQGTDQEWVRALGVEPTAGSPPERRRDDANCDTGGEADYTPEAMRAKIQGLVTLEVVVLRDGGPGDIRIVRSLDPGGLDRRGDRRFASGDSTRAA